MKKIKALIVDDERLAREELKLMLKDFPEIEVIAEAKNGEEGIQFNTELRPDLIFLDVSMPGMTGFEMIKQLDEIPNVIFITAFDEFALKAFEVSALDYLLKPVEPVRLKEAIQKIEEKDDFSSEVKITPNRQNRFLTINDRVFIKDGERCWFVEISKIRKFESEGNYVKIFFDTFKPMVLRTLNSFEERLHPEDFFRASRKHLINIHWIDTVENWFNGGLLLTMKDGEKIEVSRRQAIKFKDELGF
ncbi:MAG: LytTR family DNA-binding domain-containing protein [Crocinitomicaceae bacterium]|jgi:two-component system LytT family response regulator|nr:LytTR family DNA-binding domain-containing protein [Crocinitomicaceae bacterium]